MAPLTPSLLLFFQKIGLGFMDRGLDLLGQMGWLKDYDVLHKLRSEKRQILVLLKRKHLDPNTITFKKLIFFKMDEKRIRRQIKKQKKMEKLNPPRNLSLKTRAKWTSCQISYQSWNGYQ